MSRLPDILPPAEEAEINLTSMLDVVFIMLIFFIVSTSFVRESGVDIERPSASSAEQQNQTSVLIAITAEGEVWLERKPIDMRMVRPSLERLKAQQSELNAVIQADQDSKTGDLVKLIDQLRQAGVKYTVAAKPQ